MEKDASYLTPCCSIEYVVSSKEEEHFEKLEQSGLLEFDSIEMLEESEEFDSIICTCDNCHLPFYSQDVILAYPRWSRIRIKR